MSADLSAFQLAVLWRLRNSGYETEANAARAAWEAGQGYTLGKEVGVTFQLRSDFEIANREATNDQPL